jgi:predicted nucleic acid-binding Zn ribbon protein
MHCKNGKTTVKMASYEYVCVNEHRQIEIRAITATDNSVVCEQCSEEMTRVYSAPVITFNGTGWGRDR